MAPASVPPDPAALLRLSEFEREQGQSDAGADITEAGGTRLSALNPSLTSDLMRFGGSPGPGQGLDMLEVMAASLRHGQAVLVHLQIDWRVLPLTLLPATRQVLMGLPLAVFVQWPLQSLRVRRVASAPRAHAVASAAIAPSASGEAPGAWLEPLAPLAWELALRGARATLLPEVGGVAAYRVAPAADLHVLQLRGSLAAAVARLRERTAPLREIARWPGLDRERAMRLLNGLYLQSALIVTRTHPSALE